MLNTFVTFFFLCTQVFSVFVVAAQLCQIRKAKDFDMSQSNRRSGKRKQWTGSEMVGALDAVLNKHLPANKAAKLYGVPPSTLKDRLSGRVVHSGVNPGPKQYLTKQEVKELTDHLVLSAKVGYGKTRRDAMNMVETSTECLKALQDKEKQMAEQKKEQSLLKKKLKEEELKYKQEEKACEAALKEAEKQRKKPIRRKQGNCRSSRPEVAADNLMPDVPTDDLVADVTTDNQADEPCSSRGPSKRKSTSHARLVRRDQRTVPMMKLMSTGAVCVLVCMLMMLILGGSGYSVNAQDGFTRIVLMMMM